MDNPLLFDESYAAAISMKNSWTKLASTMWCMKIQLTPHDIIIRPHWIMSGLIKALQLDLDHRFPVSRIEAIQHLGTHLQYQIIEISYRDKSGKKQKLKLFLRNANLFEEELQKLK